MNFLTFTYKKFTDENPTGTIHDWLSQKELEQRDEERAALQQIYGLYEPKKVSYMEFLRMLPGNDAIDQLKIIIKNNQDEVDGILIEKMNSARIKDPIEKKLKMEQLHQDFTLAKARLLRTTLALDELLGRNRPRLEASTIIDRVDTLAFAERYLPNLKVRGDKITASCPFHNEKTPSFSFSRSKKVFYCFGCGEKGSLIDFLMKKEGLNFKSALRLLNTLTT